ncbi:MAG: hypothetical protein IJL18_04290 [Synergistaceae bacterium]|nr:hypothetical protein [Synergistaceae bacterium]
MYTAKSAISLLTFRENHNHNGYGLTGLRAYGLTGLRAGLFVCMKSLHIFGFT